MYKYLIAIILLSLTLTVSAFTVYKKVNKDGTVTYSDKPFPGAKKAKLPPINTRATQPIPKPIEVEKPEKKAVANITVLSPTNGDSIRSNAGELNIRIGATHDAVDDYLIQLLINEKPYGKPTKNTTFALKELDRGIIKIKALLQTRRGKVLAASDETVVYMHKASINRAR
ncbi:DUF4124 domain-containing protein [Psychrobium sp. MM17-31]|uniref:DUF4124 domain-containing protein n=1 Tax=Psychrobium sp. MM17-31 TaxID=2917758 RepID=UPI001EF6F5CC|nr:DUF4124 domain-containing protein [Psychrobium sp. MM17-31]MCG7533013.1 DUF4124 domain-containing protein [Psychrobium sp. MM17-31]